MRGEPLESKFQSKLIKQLEDIFPGCVVLKNDSGYKKNIPDLTVFYKNHYAILEVKRSERAFKESTKEDGRKNQEYYVNKFNDWSFASFVYPENVDQVLSRMKEVFDS